MIDDEEMVDAGDDKPSSSTAATPTPAPAPTPTPTPTLTHTPTFAAVPKDEDKETTGTSEPMATNNKKSWKERRAFSSRDLFDKWDIAMDVRIKEQIARMLGRHVIAGEMELLFDLDFQPEIDDIINSRIRQILRSRLLMVFRSSR